MLRKSSGENLSLTPGAHAFTSAANATLTYFVTGTGPRLLVNVAPGWGCSSGLYLESFSENVLAAFTLVHLECRGTRGSSPPADPGALSSWHMAEDVEALRAHLGLAALDVMGHSNGGAIALWHAIRFPARVVRLVLVGSSLLGSRAEAVRQAYIRDMLAARRHGEEVDAVDAFFEYVREAPRLETDQQMGAYFDRFLPLYLAQPERDMAAWKAAWSVTPQVKLMQAHARVEPLHFDQEDQLGSVTARTLIVVGRQDFICAPPVSEAIAAGIAESTLSIVEDCGHNPWIERKEEFARILKEFFASK